jgi:hypothetical protein
MRFICLDENNKVVSIRFGDEIVEGEIQSDTGELGQIMQPDGTFITPEPEPVEPVPTLEDKINYIYYKQMGVII